MNSVSDAIEAAKGKPSEYQYLTGVSAHVDEDEILDLIRVAINAFDKSRKTVEDFCEDIESMVSNGPLFMKNVSVFVMLREPNEKPYKLGHRVRHFIACFGRLCLVVIFHSRK